MSDILSTCPHPWSLCLPSPCSLGVPHTLSINTNRRRLGFLEKATVICLPAPLQAPPLQSHPWRMPGGGFATVSPPDRKQHGTFLRCQLYLKGQKNSILEALPRGQGQVVTGRGYEQRSHLECYSLIHFLEIELASGSCREQCTSLVLGVSSNSCC